MAISAKDVMRLREATGVGMMDCKKALTEADGDFDQAIDLLRKKGQKVAAARSDRDATEGAIVSAATGDGQTAVLVEVNSETDFVARNSDFIAFADSLAALALATRPDSLEAFRSASLDGETVADALTRMTGKVGEKIDVRRVAVLEASEGGTVVGYIHPGAKLGVLVEMEGSGDDLAEAGRDVAMQAAAMNPIAATRKDVPQDVQDKELSIGREQAAQEGKPEAMLDKISEGKLNRYFKDNVLVEQPFVKDSSMTVEKMLAAKGASLRRFVRFALGG